MSFFTQHNINVIGLYMVKSRTMSKIVYSKTKIETLVQLVYPRVQTVILAICLPLLSSIGLLLLWCQYPP
jgi:hypothetical protein